MDDLNFDSVNNLTVFSFIVLNLLVFEFIVFNSIRVEFIVFMLATLALANLF